MQQTTDVISDVFLRVLELGLEYGVCGMEFNSKRGVYKQEWHYQACLVFNSNPNVYY